MEKAYVKSETKQMVTTIEFFHPQSNSLPGATLNLLANTIEEAGRSADSTCIVLRSGGEKAFCAGASFDELMAINDRSAGLEFFSGFAKVINAMRKCPKFIIGRVQGKTVGGGVGLASSTDYCFGTQAASIKLSELAVGIGPFVVGPAVERKMGKSAFAELSIDASEWRTAHWALEKGLFNHLFDSTKELDVHLEAFTSRISTYNPEAMAELKRIFWEGTEHWDHLLYERAAISGRLVLSEFTRESIERFKSRNT